ncbi:restriction endonuclease [Streptomyces sp. NPDC048269]|uniref:restriction endonuclease n=1 Tax=Streptomyces sp. NPDC048269 TaxID=3155753 RepID=UPI003443756D
MWYFMSVTRRNPRFTTTDAPPARRQIQSWQDAEHNAAAWMRHWGFRDAQAKPGGADGGIDVRSRHALGQVKYQAAAVGRPELQNLFGARGRDMDKQLLFFTGSSYATTALQYADTNDIALFVYALDGAMVPVNKVARRIGNPPIPVTPPTPDARSLRLTAVTTTAGTAAPPPPELPQARAQMPPGGGRIVLGLILAVPAVMLPRASTTIPWPNTTVMTIGLLVTPLVLIFWGLAEKNRHSFVPTGTGLVLINVVLGWMMNRRVWHESAENVRITLTLTLVILVVAPLLIWRNARARARAVAAAATAGTQATSDSRDS